MPRILRVAEVAWAGSLSRGSGTATAGSSGAFELPFDLPSRAGDPGGKTSPEELLAAAHAACYATSLAGEVARAGGTVGRLDIRCTITMDEVESGAHRVVASDLDVAAAVDGLDADGLDAAAAAADAGCPFSALLRASAAVSVRVQLASD